MATRLYLPSAGAPDITPAVSTGWNVTAQVDRIKGWRSPQNSSETNITRDETETTNVNVCARQYIYGPFGAHDFTGCTVKGQIGAGQNNLNRDCRAQRIIRVIDPDGSTVIGTLLDFDTDALTDPAASEFANTAVNRPFPRDGAVAVAAISGPEGFYIADEVGYRSHNVTGAITTVTFRFGDEFADTDLPEDSTSSSANARPWIEFSHNLPMPAADAYEEAIRDAVAGGPFSHYSMDEVAGSVFKDKAQSHDMTIAGAPTLDQAGPFTGWKAASFDGVDDTALAQVIDYSGPGTTIGWAKTDDVGQLHPHGWWDSAVIAATTAGQHTFEVDDEGGTPKWKTHYVNGAGTPTEIDGPTAVADTWVLLAITAGAGGLKFYAAVADDVTQQGATDTGTTVLTYQVHRFCSDKDGAQFGDWLVSKETIFHSELSEAQLQTIYDAAGGGTLFQQSVGGTVTPSGVLLKELQKRLAGSATPAGTIIKKGRKVFSGSTTPIGVLIRRSSRSFTGTLTPAGDLTKRPKRAYAGIVMPAGALTVRLVRLLSLSGSITPAGVLLNKTKKLLSGSLALVGVVVWKTKKLLSGTITPVGDLTQKVVIRVAFAGLITPAGILVRRTQRFFAGTLAPAGFLSKKLPMFFSGTITPNGLLLKRPSKFFSGIITPSGTNTNRLLLTLSVSGSITPVGVLVKRVSRSFAGTLSPVGALIKRASIHLSGSIAPAASLVVTRVQSIFLSGTITLTGTVTTISTAVQHVFQRIKRTFSGRDRDYAPGNRDYR